MCKNVRQLLEAIVAGWSKIGVAVTIKEWTKIRCVSIFHGGACCERHIEYMGGIAKKGVPCNMVQRGVGGT